MKTLFSFQPMLSLAITNLILHSSIFFQKLICHTILTIILIGTPTDVFGKSFWERDRDFILFWLIFIMVSLIINGLIKFIVRIIVLAGNLIKIVFKIVVVAFFFAVYADAESTGLFFRRIFGSLITLMQWLLSFF